ncbi:hypothetical protein [Massilia pseudoviolaceinigra]|uniref:hypothetical protein n=1 Tax=Massilia pseudoviolaceinigra TaxID=3057165 RepID=UPI002796CC65|nr:hypothetical protein [Massilia sp. CCM 9206]MDQ1923310.1 hypothetical protein [Massilia sp. CCM 9206]
MRLHAIFLGALLPLLALSGCASSRMYQGPTLDRSELALLFIHGRPNSKYRMIDGKPVDFIYGGRVLEFAPGKHVFQVELSTFRIEGWPISRQTTDFLIGTYENEIDMRPGYTYAHDFHTVNAHQLPDSLCMDGEPHDAPGSSVNATGEFRRMSPTGEKLVCVRAESVRPNKK